MANELDLTESTETLPEYDRRAAIVGELKAMCEELVKISRDLVNEQNERMIGRLEERWFTMRREIMAKQERAYLDEGIYVDISSTDKCHPIRVREKNKMTPWGRVSTWSVTSIM